MAKLDNTLNEVLDLASLHFKVPRENLSPDDDFFKKLAGPIPVVVIRPGWD